MRPVDYALIVSLLSTIGTVAAQEYPNRAVRVFAAEAGGGADLGARVLAQALSGNVGHQFIVDNRGPAAIELAAKAPPDGYNLLYYGSTVWVQPLLQKVSYDPERDLIAISLVNIQPSVLVVHPSLPVKNVRELVALAKARPRELNYAAGVTGSSGQLAGELFKSMAKVDIVHIPYKGNGPANVALLAGEVQLTFGTTGAMAGYLKSGRLRAIAVTTARPSALLPGIPTVAESGLVPGYEASTLTGFFAPAKTPAAIISRLSEETLRALRQTDVRQKYLALGAEVVGSTPAEFAATIRSETAKWSQVIKRTGLRSE